MNTFHVKKTKTSRKDCNRVIPVHHFDIRKLVWYRGDRKIDMTDSSILNYTDKHIQLGIKINLQDLNENLK